MAVHSKLIFAFLITLSISIGGSAQDDVLKRLTPITPDAASLGKYGEIPVSLYTGVPNITIPLYEIDVNGFKMPISISYHASGIKVGDIASAIGLGWSLSAGGVINRNQNGIMDERMLSNYSYYQNEVEQMSDPNTTENDKQLIALSWSANNDYQGYDVEPDIFYFNFLKSSGKFFHDPQGNVYMMPVDNRYTIEHEDTYQLPNNENAWARWIITDNNGIKYVFGRSVDGLRDNFEQSCMSGGDIICNDNSSVNSWYLSEIILLGGKKIEFKYDVTSYTVPAISSLVNYYTNTCNLSPTVSERVINYQRVLKLKEITYPNGKVVFVPGNLRSDIADRCIDRIEFYSGSGTVFELIKEYRFLYNSYRPMLTEVRDVDLSNAQIYKSHKFYYNSLSLPQSNISPKQDLWGYYNGADNSSLVPALINVPLGNNQGNMMPGANRAVDPDYTQAAILNKIVYPTGGSSEFEYENNTAICDAAINDITWCNTLNYTLKYPKTNITTTLVQAENLGSSSGNKVYSSDFECSFNTVLVFNDHFIPYETGEDCSPFIDGEQKIYGCVEMVLERKLEDNSYQVVTSDFWFGLGYPVNEGIYRISLKWKTNAKGMFYASVKYDQDKIPTQIDEGKDEIFVGGVRIKKITSYDAVADKTVIKKYDYTLENSDPEYPGATSGIPMNMPIYIHNSPACGQLTPTFAQLCAELTLTAQPIASILGTDNIPVGYRKVTVLEGENGENGKSETYHTTALVHPDEGLEYSAVWPFPNARTYQWRRGLETETINFKKEGDMIPLKRTLTNYTFASDPHPNFHEFVTTKIYKNPVVITQGSTSTCSSTPGYVQYTIGTESFFPSQTTEEIYKPDGSSIDIEIQKAFTQDSKSLNIVLEEMLNSSGVEISEKSQWPLDYDLSPGSLSQEAVGIQHLISKNIVTIPVEKLVIKKLGDGNKYVIDGTLNVFHPDKPTVFKIYKLRVAAPVLLSGFTLSYVNNTGLFIKDDRYEEIVSFAEYDNNFSILEQQKADDVKHSYIWGYNNQYPIAEVINAPVKDIFHTSFEEDGDSNESKTGRKSKTGVFNKSLTGLTPGVYILSYWRKPGSTWEYIESEQTVAGSTFSIGLSGHIDEVRFYPKNAEMTTYTYDPLIGMTSRCDINNRITYYEYDSFGRLHLVRDQDKNIVKKICYNYAGQEENCLRFGNQLQSLSIQREDCPDCHAGSYVTYTVPTDTYFAGSQAAADALALDDINTNGQGYANTNGTCTAPVMTNLIGTNMISDKFFTIVFHNNCTGINYTYYFSSTMTNVTLSPMVPTGNYNVSFTPDGGTGTYQYIVNSFYQYTTLGNILGVDIVAGSNQVRIMP